MRRTFPLAMSLLVILVASVLMLPVFAFAGALPPVLVWINATTDENFVMRNPPPYTETQIWRILHRADDTLGRRDIPEDQRLNFAGPFLDAIGEKAIVKGEVGKDWGARLWLVDFPWIQNFSDGQFYYIDDWKRMEAESRAKGGLFDKGTPYERRHPR